MEEDSGEEYDLYYHNAVKILEGSDDEEPEPTVVPVKVEEVLVKPPQKVQNDPPQKRRRGAEKEQIEGVDSRCTRNQRRRMRKRQTSCQYDEREKNIRSAQNSGEEQIQMLNIIEINDSPIRLPCGNIGGVPPSISSRDSPVELLRQMSDSSDIIPLDDSISCIDVDDVDVEVAIHVNWRAKAVHAFHLKKSDKLKSIFGHFAKLENVLEQQVLLTHSGKSVYAHDTPEKFKSGVIVLDGNLKRLEGHQTSVDPNSIELNVIRNEKKGKLRIHIARTDTMEVFMDKTANELSLPRDRLKFMFDGEILQTDDTPESLDLEGGECIEVIVHS